MTDSQVDVFFYGSFINVAVLADVGLVPERTEVARLWGYDLRIEPLANVVPSDQRCVYGVVVRADHDELGRLYGQSWVGTYLPRAVVVETLDGRQLPALCYVAPSPPVAPAAADYVERIAGPARELGFPEWYRAHIESFRPDPEAGA